MTICQSNPSNGQCLSPPASSITFTDEAGSTLTFSAFLQAIGTIPFDPANSRVFVRFEDAYSVPHGSTSAAIETM
jgi:hypothetical protein